MKNLVLLVSIVLNSVTLSSCWQFFTSIKDQPLHNSELAEKFIHSEYMYGDCRRKDIVLYTHTHLDNLQVIGKIIIRGWLDIKRIPTCILLRATSEQTDLFRSTAYQFQICVPRITYCHTHRRFKYFYYEWYLPYDYIGGMNWDLYFFGSPNLEWQ